MSWSVSATGKPGPVAAKVAARFEEITYLAGVENELKTAAAALVATAVAAQSDSVVVKVSCSGSLSSNGDVHKHELRIEVAPIHDFTD